MEVDQGEHEALEVLHQVEEGSEAVRVFRLLHFGVGADLGGLQAHLPAAHSDDKLLLADFVRLGPLCVLALEDAAFEDDPAHLVDDSLRNEG